MFTWKITQGAGNSWVAPIVDSCSQAETYIGTEALSGDVWPGGSLASLLTLAPTWLDPAAGTTSVAINESDSATLAPGKYQVVLRVTNDFGETRVYARGEIEVLVGPGSTVVGPAYCTHADLLTAVPWIDSLQGQNPTGFPYQRRAAREWTDELIQRHYRGGSGLSRDDYFLPWPQYTPGNPNHLVGVYRSGASSVVLQQWLDAGGLKLSRSIVEANTYFAVAKVLESQITRDPENQYKALSNEFYAKAENAILLTDAEIDASGSTYAKTCLTVKMGAADTLEG